MKEAIFGLAIATFYSLDLLIYESLKLILKSNYVFDSVMIVMIGEMIVDH